MNRTPGPLEQSDAEAKDVAATLHEVKPEDIDSKWIDTMVHKLFRELEKQLKAVETFAGTAKAGEIARFNKNADTLQKIQRTIKELIVMETQRDNARATKATRKPSDVREKLAQQLSEVVERRGQKRLPGPAK
jgi:hypothetical protein